MAFLADGERIVAVGKDFDVILCHVEDGRILRELRGNETTIGWIAISPDERFVATGAHDNSVRLFSLDSGDQLLVMRGHESWVWGVEFDPQGEELFSISRDRTLARWSVKNGELLERKELHDDEINGLDISNDGKLLATVSDDKTVRIWNRFSLAPVATLTHHAAVVNRVRFVDGDKYLASADETGMVYLSSTADGEIIAAFNDFTNNGTNRSVWGLATGKTTPYFACAGTNGLVQVRQAPSGQLVAQWSLRSEGLLSVAFDDAQGTVVAGGGEGHLVRWQIGRANSEHTLAIHHLRDIVIASTGDPSRTYYSQLPSIVGRWPPQADRRPANEFVTDDRVHFTVTAPRTLKAGGHYVIDVWAHLNKHRAEIMGRAREQAGEDIRSQSKGPALVTHGTLLTVSLRASGLVVSDPVDTMLWVGEVTNASFPVMIPNDTKPGSYPCVAKIAVDHQPVLTISFVVHVDREAGKPAEVESRQRRFATAFASYASEDRDEVLARIQGMQKVAPACDVFLDQARLRSGEDWQASLRREIIAREVLFLFWSVAASRSKWVDWEWRCALQEKGIEAIDPVPLVSPAAAPPPMELRGQHFNDWILAYMTRRTRSGGSGGRTFFYSFDGHGGFGPVTSAEIRSLVHDGLLTKVGKISRDGLHWHPASALRNVEWPSED